MEIVIIYVVILINTFLYGANVYVFISMVLFLWLKIVKNCPKWVYMGMGEISLFGIKRSCPKEQQSTLLTGLLDTFLLNISSDTKRFCVVC